VDRKMCKVDVVAADCYGDNKSVGIGYLNNSPILFIPLLNFNPAMQPACRNGRTCYTDEFCIVNSTSAVCYDGMLFLINNNLWRVKKGRWTIEDNINE